MSPIFDAETGAPLGDNPQADTPTPCNRPTVDVASCHFEGTFRHPCFWILVGVSAALAVQYLFAQNKKNSQ
jgi:hypothetical protein